mmetsp:Transcript_12428/g.14273  ORF Transcript_12428/g.14273 Transcript_12428/m.14273 type:complete len:479 (+) Transcript_12428:305-1741(+)
MGKGYAESKDGMEKEGINISSFWKFALLFVVVDTIVVLMALLALVAYGDFKPYADLAEEYDVTFYNSFHGFTIDILIACLFVLAASTAMVVGRHSRRVAMIFVGTLGAASAVQIVFGSLLFVSLAKHESTLCTSSDCNPVETDFDEQQLGTLAMEQFIFNTCCFPFVDQFNEEQKQFHLGLGLEDPKMNETRVQFLPTIVCQEDNGVLDVNNTCPPANFLPELIESFIDTKLLCTCIPDSYAAVESEIVQKINDNNVCASLEKVRFKFNADLDIPTTTTSIFSAIGGADGYQSFSGLKDDVDDVPLVGNPGVPTDSAVDNGFGCGLMFTKGYMWYTTLFLDQTFKKLAYTSLAVGTIGFIFASAQALFIILQACGGEEYDDRFDDEYGDDQLDVHYGNPANGPAVISNDEAELIDFYSKHDPGKLVNGRVDADVMAFVESKGIKYLNEKLIEKYGSGISSLPSSAAASSKADEIDGII